MNRFIEKFYNIADMSIKVRIPEQWYEPGEGPLTEFENYIENEDYCMELDVVENLTVPEGELIYRDSGKRIYSYMSNQIRYEGSVEKSLKGAIYRIFRHDNASYIQIQKDRLSQKITQKLILNVMEMEHLIVQNGGFMLHASYIEYEGGAVLFTAPSGTGKSTQASLWNTLCGAEIINGDCAAVKNNEQEIVACGVPFSGSSGICKNVTLPLKAIVYLEQAEETTIKRLTGIKAFRRIWEGCSVNSWNQEDVSRCLRNVMNVVEKVPIYQLSCTPDETAVNAVKCLL